MSQLSPGLTIEPPGGPGLRWSGTVGRVSAVACRGIVHGAVWLVGFRMIPEILSR